MTNSYDPNLSLGFNYDSEEMQQAIQQQAEKERLEAEQIEAEIEAENPTPDEPEPEKDYINNEHLDRKGNIIVNSGRICVSLNDAHAEACNAKI